MIDVSSIDEGCTRFMIGPQPGVIHPYEVPNEFLFTVLFIVREAYISNWFPLLSLLLY